MSEFIEGFNSVFSLKFWGTVCGFVITIGVPTVVILLTGLLIVLICVGLQKRFFND